MKRKLILTSLLVLALVATLATVTGCAGEPGLKGDQGPMGLQGIQGEQGEQGKQGLTGEQGEAGIQGVAGSAGAKGATGSTGATGAQGPQGEVGPAGPRGSSGSKGAIGPAGPSEPTALSIALVTLGVGKAEWTHDQSRSGIHSVYLEAGATVDDVGGILIATEPIPIQDFTGVKFWVYELAETLHGGVHPYFYGDPYINIKLDLDGDLINTPGDVDFLEGVGTDPVIAAEWPDYADTWTEMEEAWFYDGGNSMASGYTIDNAKSLGEWKTYLVTPYPNAVVTQIQIIFGWWADPSNGKAYVDDVTINSVIYDLGH